MSFEATILCNNDMLGELLKYLTFNDKLVLGKACNKIFIKFYNKTKNIREQYDYLFVNLSRNWINHITDVVLDKLYEMNKINFSDYYYYCIEQLETSRKKDFELNMSMMENNIDFYYSNIKSTLFSIYARILVELCDEYNVNCEKILISVYSLDNNFNSFESKLAPYLGGNLIYKRVLLYYEKIFEEVIDMNDFCYTCGEHGHLYNSSCLFI